MIKVTCVIRDNSFSLVKIGGHAGYAQKGSDIVCAGVSSIVEGTQSFFRTRYCNKISISSNKSVTTFSVTNYTDDSLQACLQMFVHQLRNFSHFYPDYVLVETDFE